MVLPKVPQTRGTKVAGTEYALEGGEIRRGLTERVLCVLGPGDESVPGVLVAVAEGTEVAPYLLDLLSV